MVSDIQLQKVHCGNCGSLIAKANIKEGTLSIKCRKCGHVNMIAISVQIEKTESQGFTERLRLNRK
jgi:phage FluMu protein Com